MSGTASGSINSGSSTIFVGSSLDLQGLANNAIANPLIADGNVGLYGHMSGIVVSNQQGYEGSIIAKWAGTGAGLVELGDDEPMALMSVTIKNNGIAAIIIPIGQLVSSAEGIQYQIVQKPRQEDGWSNQATGDGTAGYYTIEPGQSLALMTQALVDGPSGNLMDNQVTQIDVAGASITSSSLIEAADQWSAGTVTLTNTTGTAQIIYERMIVTGAHGTYEIGVDPTVIGFVSTDSDRTSGYYTLAAGGSVTVPVASVNSVTGTTQEALVAGEASANADANSIVGTGTLPSGVIIAASSALVTTGAVNPEQQQHVDRLGSNSGFFTNAISGYFTTNVGYVPTEADVNTWDDNIWTAKDLDNWKAYVDSARAVGYLNLAPMMSEFETVDFATAPATQYARAAALYSGGITFDMPSWFFLAREPAYQQSVEAEIKWATANGLRSSITLSPESGNDENFLVDTQRVVAMLEAAGALPTQFVVKDGGVTGTAVLYSTTDPNSLNSVANYLSSLVLTPSNSESGLETRGTGSRPDDLMTGVAPSLVILGGGPTNPFSIAQVFGETTISAGTLTVTSSSASFGRLSVGSGLGNVSTDGMTYTVSGTMAQLTADLETLTFCPATGANGTTTLNLSISDSAGIITGSTVITVDNSVTFSGLATTASAVGPLFPDQSTQLGAALPSEVLTATISLSDRSLGEFWNFNGGTLSADGKTVTMSGTSAVLQTYLQNLQFIPTPNSSGSEIQTVSITDGTQTVSSTEAIIVSPATALAIANVPVNVIATSGITSAPYENILITKSIAPTQILSVTVTLPTGSAIFANPSVGTVSANGLVYTYNGNVSQLQTALRSLNISVPPASSSSKEALTLNFNGHISRTTLNIVSTDTIFVGSQDSNQSQYALPIVATPLLATGEVGLFDDYNAATATVVAGTAASVKSVWAGAAAGVYTSTIGNGLALQTVSIANKTGSAITIPVGTLVGTASGVQFQIVQYNAGNANWIAGSTGDGTIGSYVIAAGSTLSLTAEAVVAGYAGNVAVNAITSVAGISGATVTASSPLQLATEYASGTVTLTNTTSAAITVYEGTAFSNATGSYQIGNDPSAAGFFAYTTDKSYGSYTIAAGSSSTVPVYGTNAQSGTAANALAQILAQTTTATNSLASTGLPAGLTIAGSSAISTTGPTGALASQIYGSWGPNTGVSTDRGYGTFLPGQGVTPSEANINLPLATSFTAGDLASWQAYVDTMRGFGVLNVAPVVTSPSLVLDIAHSDATAALRSAALYGGGIDIDTTPSEILAMGATAIASLVDDINWAAANGLRSTMTLRAYGDTSFLENTRSVLAQLQAAGALPSQIAVVGTPTSSTISSPELANAVAQYAATLALTPSAAESGLETTGGTTIDAIMTGVQSRLTLVGTAPAAPYAGVQVFDTTPSTVLTAIVALTDTLSGTLSTTGAGTLSADASTLTVSGTTTQIDAALAALRYTPATGANGTTTLNLSISDSAGIITGSTVITVDNSVTFSGLATTASAVGPLFPDQSTQLGAALPSEVLTATISLSDRSLGEFWNFNGGTLSADGKTVTMSGTSAVLQTYLQNLQFIPTPNSSGSEIQTVSITDGTQTVSSTEAIIVSPATALAIANVPVNVIATSGITSAPYENILITKSIAPTQILSVTVTLPTGSAIFANPSVGTVSANGLVYTYNGNVSQLQTALRSLNISVPPASSSSKEALTLNFNGHISRTTLNIVSTDTIFVGSQDSNQSQYALPIVATPLLATGEVGLFDDYNAATATVVAGTAASVKSVWAGAAAGVYTSTIGNGLALQTVSIANKTGSAITIPVGTLVGTASGVQFQIVQYNAGNANWIAGSTGDGTIGSYVIAAGSTLSLTAEAVVAGYAGNVAVNAITSVAGISGATVTASSPLQLATEYASGTVTLTNTTSAAITVYEGTAFSNATGSYQIGNDPSAAGFFAYTTDKSYGSYTIAAGSSSTVPVYGTNAQSGTAANALAQILAQTTTATNSLASTGLPAGLTIAGSSAISTTGPTGALASQIYGSWGPNTGVSTDRGYGTFLPGQGVTPSEANINLPLATSFTAGDLASWQAYVDTMRGFGVLNVAPVVTSPSLVLDIAHSDATAALRSAALYGGGIDIDTTPSEILAMGATAIASLVDDINWAAANGLRSTMTLRAYGDTSFLENTRSVLAQLQAAGALPSQIAVVGTPTSSTISSPELANAVAQYAATLALTPSAAESGLETTGGTTIDAIMTGVQSRLTLVGTAPAAPYAGVQVFDTTPSTVLTAIVALTDTLSGTLSTTGAGTLSADASTLTVSGTTTQIDAALAALRYTPATGANGTTTLNLSISDSAGIITGSTALCVNNSPIKLSLKNLTNIGSVGLDISPQAGGRTTIFATTGGNVVNGVFHVSDTVTNDAASLAGVIVVPGLNGNSANLQISIGGSGVELTDNNLGQDTITSAGYNLIDTGNATTCINSGTWDTISAGSGSVSIQGSNAFAFIGGLSSADTVVGGSGGGVAYAGSGGKSILVGGTGLIGLHASGANDTLIGGGQSVMYAASGLNSFIALSSGDTAVGADTALILGPTNGTKYTNIFASSGNETVSGGAGSMSVVAGSGNVDVTLGTGNTTITGCSGSDTVHAGLNSLATVNGGNGKQIMEFQNGSSTGASLVFNGFISGSDKVLLSGYGSGAIQQVIQTQSTTVGGTTLTLSDGSSIMFSGISHISSTDLTSI